MKRLKNSYVRGDKLLGSPDKPDDPSPGCGLTQPVIEDQSAECWIHREKKMMICGECTAAGYTAYDGRGDGRMYITNSKLGTEEDYTPIYGQHPALPPEPLF